MTDILFIGRHPDRYAPFWRQLIRRNYSLVFVKTHCSAIRKLEQNYSGYIFIDSDSLNAQAGTVCRALRRRVPAAAVICIASDKREPRAPADYFLCPPLRWEAFSEALKKTDRRQQRDVIDTGGFTLDTRSCWLVGPRGEKRLTPKMTDLLALLLVNAGQIVSRTTIMQQVWRTDYTEDTRTLDVHISWLRRNIEPDPLRPRYLITKRGAGYVLYAEGRPAHSGSNTAQP